MTQKEKIIEILERDGRVDNYYCIDNKISIRLGAIINVLKKEGWEFDGKFLEGTKNYCYWVIPKKTLF